MKLNTSGLLLASTIMLAAACSKSATQQDSIAPSTLASEEDFSTFKTDSGTTIIKYRPGPNNGNDVYLSITNGVGSGNLNSIPELPINSWAWSTNQAVARGFIQFPKLDNVSPQVTIVSAKLHLYPPKDFLNHPQGNNGVNTCIVERITSKAWLENQITWETQPASGNITDAAYIPTSTDQWDYRPVIDLTTSITKIVKRQVPNYGFRIKLVDEHTFSSAVNFASSEAEDSWRRPMLEIEYK